MARKAAIRLLENPRRAIAQAVPDYVVMLHDRPVYELTHNLRGYVGYLPTPEGAALSLGERPLSEWRAEAARLNREFAARAAG